MDPPSMGPRPWTLGRLVVTVLGAGLIGLGALIVGYAVVIVARNPLLFIIGVPFAIFGALLIFAGLALAAGSWLRSKLKRRKA